MLNQNWFWLPGIIAHELAHYVACVLLGLPVSRVQLFGSDPHVEHVAPADLRSLVVALFPLVFNFALGFWCWTFFLDAFQQGSLWAIFWVWCSFTILFLAFPSKPDLKNAQLSLHAAWHHSTQKKNWLRTISISLLALPLYGLLIGLLILDVVWPLRLLLFIPLIG